MPSPHWLGPRLAACAALVLAVALLASAPVAAAGGDYPVSGGRVYTQTAGEEAPEGAGFLISDDGGILFWTEFQRLGGVPVLGYPVTQRFEWDGLTVQAMQKAVMQWDPTTETVRFMKILNLLSEAGLDDELAREFIPPVQSFDEAHLSEQAVAARRLALLDASPPIKARYWAAGDPTGLYGLPTSEVASYPDLQAIRLERAVLQLWLVDRPWARAGEVTVANGGDLAKAAGLFPAAATMPLVPGERDDPLVVRVNEFRASMGLPPLQQSSALMRAAQAHADYYIRNLGDPAAGGLHTEVPGKPGFTGASIYDRAKAAGYPLNWIDETFGFLEPRQTLEWALATVFHRYMFVHPSAVHIGYGTATYGGTTVAIFNVGLSPEHTAAVPLPSVYPTDGASGVPRQWDGAEWPDPAPGVPRPLGPPITLQFGLDDRVTWGEAALLDPSGQPLPVAVSTSDWRRALAVIPHHPLAPGAVYILRVTGIRNGSPFSFQSQFTSAA